MKEDFKEEKDNPKEEDPIHIREKTRKLADMEVHIGRMIEIFTGEKNLMDTGMRVMENMTKDKIKECLEEHALSTKEKGIDILNVRRSRTSKGQHW